MKQNINEVPVRSNPAEKEGKIVKPEKERFIDFMLNEAISGEATLEQIEDAFGPVSKTFLDDLEEDRIIRIDEKDGETIITLLRENVDEELLQDFDNLDKAA
jgi:hypothetical protein